MTTADPTRSPPGTETAWGYTHLPPGRDDLSEDEIAEHVDILERVVERHAPGFADRIVARYVQSPATLRDNNPNLSHGAINGGTAQPHQQLIFRPTIGTGRASTPIDRLFLAGSSAHPGGGVHGAAGANAAHAALRRAGTTGAAGQFARTKLMRHLYKE
jgi:phytoene dehydrogenase-like protein